ncbi:phosphatase PAP2 family protein [Gloeocapsopsis crepidinum LEGE 06123]|uniref:Phosphatase PAP2 family protein n=1 Tax=Gloeocapsopsis crepidinum LEGE 06123 TaxID=588587 RepID=A0ABR9UWY4_9CHRO|nr:phosphatase PAP2 family protein [Gloeocapsopsis crepidinum]MBE9192822.1 phosphatase PAP2 family protein [Gloeocapsopsis crepidinum LEGE 06123]
MRSRLISLVFRIRVAGILLAGLSLWIFAQIADEVLEKESYALDTKILLTIRQLHNTWLDQAMIGATFLGDPVVLFIVCLVVGLWLYRQHRSEATTIGIAAVGAVLLNYWLKQLFSRPRPALWERIVNVRDYSFPSGHAMVSLVIYGVIGYVLTTHFPRHQKLITSLTILLAIAIGFSRMYLGVHWPTDVVAGYAAGAVWLVACILSLRIWRQRRRRHAYTKDSVSASR